MHSAELSPQRVGLLSVSLYGLVFPLVSTGIFSITRPRLPSCVCHSTVASLVTKVPADKVHPPPRRPLSVAVYSRAFSFGLKITLKSVAVAAISKLSRSYCVAGSVDRSQSDALRHTAFSTLDHFSSVRRYNHTSDIKATTPP